MNASLLTSVLTILSFLSGCQTSRSAPSEPPEHAIEASETQSHANESSIIGTPSGSAERIQKDCMDADSMKSEKNPSSEIGIAVPVQSNTSEKPHWFTRYRCDDTY